MAPTREQYRPPLVSEKLVSPWTLCRAAVTGMAWAMATLGESMTFPDGDPWGAPRIRTALIDARENTGDPTRSGYNQSHVEAFLRAFGSGLKLEDVKYNKSKTKIRESLQGHYAISLAGNVGRTPAGSKLRKWVNAVGHQLLFFDWEGGQKTGTVAVIDPMTPQLVSNYVRRVPVAEMWAFGSAFQASGVFVAERYRIGHYTKQAVTIRQMAAVTLDVQQKLVLAQTGWQNADAEVDALIARYNELDAEHSALIESSGVSADVEREVERRLRAALAALTPEE